MQIQMKRWFVVVLGVALGLGWGARAQAAKQTTNQNAIGFSVAATIPRNQLDQKQSYFDLKMKTGQTQTLKTTIYNSTNRDIEVATAIHTAYTNTNGIIEYVQPAKTFDASLKVKMSDVTKVNGPAKVTVPAKGSKVVTAKVTMPAKPFNGVVLGGWYFKRVDQKVTGAVKGTTNISNQYSYVIGLKYTSGKVPAPVLKLDKVKAGLANSHRGIIPYLRNTSAVIIPKLKLSTTISKADGTTVKKATKENVQLAPNSTFKYPLLLGDQELKAGRYHLHMVAKNQDHRWVFDRDFTISKQDAKHYNQKSVDDRGISVIWFIVLGALAMLVIGLLLIWLFFLIRKRKQRKTDD